MYKMITTGLLCIAAVALKAQDAPIDSVDHTKSNTLGASSTVYTNDLIKYQSATILTGLQGRLKGLNVSPFRGMQLLRTDANTKSDIVGAIPNVGGGIYGDNSEFLISARGQSPVAIVDGVERDLYSIDPEAIESVTIQKDALSNMFLGMRSSRGALIITTKNPDAKGGFHLSLTGKFGISSALKSGPNPLSAYQYAYLLNEALLNDGKSPLYTYDDFEAYRNGTSPYLHPDVNWKDAIMNNSTTSQAYNLNVTGGGRVAQYFVSLGYYSENGLFKTSDANSYNTNFKYNRYLITSKVNINVTDEFKVSMSLMGRIEEGNQPGGISGTGYSDLLSNVWQTPNNAYPVLNPNGTYGGNASYTQNLYAQTTGSGYISSNTRDVVGTINLKYDFDKLVRGLSVGATGNISSQVRNAIVRTKQAQVFQYSITQRHTGNGIDNAGYFSYLKRYNEDGGFWYSNGTSMSNGGSVSEISPLANTLLTWEKGRKVNVGLDLTLLKNRLTLSADYYNDYYYDILQSRGKSIQLLGIAYPAENIGKTRYYGLETQLSWQDHIGKVNYYISANWSMEQNKRLFMDEQYVPYDYLKMTGQPTGAIYGLVATGFLTAKDIADGYPVMNGFNNIQAGDVKYKDMNGDGEINEFDRTVIGGDKPTCYFGIDLGFEWKGLEVTAFIQGAYNRDLYNSDRTLLEGFQVIGQSYGQAYTNLLNRWTPETAETATYPRLTAGGNMYNYGNNWNSSLFVQNGNYIRLKNATVSYKLPENFCRNYLGGLRVKIFVQGQNLLTWSRTRLQDPEVTFTSYPLQRTITTGINLNF